MMRRDVPILVTKIRKEPSTMESTKHNTKAAYIGCTAAEVMTPAERQSSSADEKFVIKNNNRSKRSPSPASCWQLMDIFMNNKPAKTSSLECEPEKPSGPTKRKISSTDEKFAIKKNKRRKRSKSPPGFEKLEEI